METKFEEIFVAIPAETGLCRGDVNAGRCARRGAVAKNRGERK